MTEKKEIQKSESLEVNTQDVETSEIDKVKIVTKLKKATAEGEDINDFAVYLDILDREGIIDRLLKVVSENPYERRKYSNVQTENSEASDWDRRKAYVYDLMKEILPKNFIQSLNKELRALRPSSSKSSLEEYNQSIYHIVKDKRLLKIIKEGFKGLGEHSLGSESTGRYEQVLGLNGIFFTFGHEYPHSLFDADDNLVVFSKDIVNEDDSICIQGELSFNCMLGDTAWQLEEMDKSLKVDFSDIFTRTMTREEISMYLLIGLCSAMSRISHPEELSPEETVYEICVNPKKLGLPQMIIVEEEPEFFYEEAVAYKSEYAQVPIISDENVIEALFQKGIMIDPEKDTFRDKFIELVNKGEINPTEWAVNKLAHPPNL